MLRARRSGNAPNYAYTDTTQPAILDSSCSIPLCTLLAASPSAVYNWQETADKKGITKYIPSSASSEGSQECVPFVAWMKTVSTLHSHQLLTVCFLLQFCKVRFNCKASAWILSVATLSNTQVLGNSLRTRDKNKLAADIITAPRNMAPNIPFKLKVQFCSRNGQTLCSVHYTF
jgi:hypothetical protein